ncbi:unnamed protein product [Acanthoscelides obtectus]|uniref:Uncharacterized protein n=1 Tax=Acanthoscelides obtectus TaxID=200917 RepID=A0A9P0KUC1_ACAOB|nr:unnamed protein product [Acanthoscelides obtectus]CAK1663043.1 hypothetical protein AOBTE_LOCUS23450 [Acanthoscelides obtectus]
MHFFILNPRARWSTKRIDYVKNILECHVFIFFQNDIHHQVVPDFIPSRVVPSAYVKQLLPIPVVKSPLIRYQKPAIKYTSAIGCIYRIY